MPQLTVLITLFVVATVTSATVSSANNVTFSCLAGWNLIGTHCYNFVNVSLDFEDARDTCHKYGASLLIVRDEVEAKSVSDLAGSRFTSDHYWILNGRSGPASYSTDVNNTSLNSTFCSGMWQPNEPRETTDHVAIASNTHGRWALMWVWMNLPFVCRAPACPTGSFRCSDGMCLNSKWTCDDDFDCKDLSDENNCTDNVRYYKSSSGTFDTTNLPVSNYYQFTIEGQPGEILRIEFETPLTIADNTDSVRVHSGGPSVITSDLIREITTSQSEKLTVFGKNHFLIVTLQTGSTGFIRSVKANWKSDPEVSRKRTETVNVTDASQLISSPYFNSSLMPGSFKMEWLLTAPEGKLIVLEVLNNTFDTRAGASVYIVTNVGFMLQQLNANKSVYISSKSNMTVIIKTDSGKQFFSAQVRTGCDFTTQLTLATFSLMNLPANLTCVWMMKNELGTGMIVRIYEAYFDDFRDYLQLSVNTDMISTMTLATLNNVSSMPMAINTPYDGVTFKYFSDIVRPGNMIQGRISADCLDISNMNNMNVSFSNRGDKNVTYSAQIMCEDGFAFKQEEYNMNMTLLAVCNEGGIWDWGSPSFTRVPTCQTVYCGFPPQIPNGFVRDIGGHVTYKAVATYQCYDGFEIKGLSNVTCEASGNWSQVPSCQAENCIEVPTVANATFNFTFGDGRNLSYGTIVKYICDPGFELLGSQQIVCLSNKSWSHEAPSCKKLTCPLPILQHGQYRSTPAALPNFGETVGLFCDSGYQINRTSTQNDTSVTCSFNRTLDPDNDVCVDIDECMMNSTSLNNCSATENCANKEGSFTCTCKNGYNGTDCSDVDECALGVCHQNCTNLAGSYSCSCYEGYILYTGNGTNGFYIPAGENGLKPGDVYQINNTCVPVLCNKGPEPPVNGTTLTVKASYYYNESVHVVCNFGYMLENSSFATCQSDGNWTYSDNPTCTKMTCPQPNVSEHETSRSPASGDIEPGASLTITCKLDNGSGKVVNKSMFCAPSRDLSGMFVLQGDNPTCPEVNCGRLLDIPGENATNVTDTTYGSSFEFACDSSRGFTVTGASTLGNTTVVCQSNGRWGYANLTCEGSRCKDPGTVGGTVQIVNTSYEIDQIVQYNCTRPGFTPVTNATLVCEYKNGTAQWSSDPPNCEDTEPPMITCPTVEPLDLYSTLVYPHPNVTDNSGISCFLVESGPTSGVTVVSNNVTVKYKAADTRSDATCEFNITVKDRTEPTIKCPSVIQRDLTGSRNELFNLTEALLVSHSGDGMIMFDPMGPINLTMGSIIPVRANITKPNGLAKECAFLVSAVSTVCMNDSLTPPDNGRIEECTGTNSSLTCLGVCDKGYLFQSTSNSTSYSCINGTWDTKFPVLPCIKLSGPTFDFDVTLQYVFNGNKIEKRDVYDREICLQQHGFSLSRLVANKTACGYSNFTTINLRRIREINSSSDELFFTLQLSSTVADENSLGNCAVTLQNQGASLFGPTNPSVSGNRSCLSPWTVNPSSVIVVPKNMSCSSNSTMVDYNGTNYCLSCGPGVFFNGSTCEECQDGYYQEDTDQAACKRCPNGVLRSHKPRTRTSHCFEPCPEGFMSTSGYIEDNCTACPENHFSKSSNSCQPCPDDGSTLGVSGATLQAQCSEPCPPGEYSISGYRPCSICPHNFYNDMPAARMCMECPTETYTVGNGTKSSSDCLNGSSLCTANFCSSDGAVNNNSCKIRHHRPMCVCKPGFYGDYCNKSCDVCNPNPCYNGGTCTASGLNFTCTCKSESTCVFDQNKKIKYTSDSQEAFVSTSVNKTECRELCLNNVTCVAYLAEADTKFCYQYSRLILDTIDNNNNSESYVKNCSVKQLFEGPMCEKDLINDCNDSVCTSIDFCMDLVGGTKCQCPYNGNYDSKCAKPDNPCQGNNCSNHGKCISYGSVRAVCECDSGYTGDRCENNINECLLNNNGCLYNGTCQDGSNTYSCSCVNGFSGSHCEVLADFCFHNDCKVADGGICTNDFRNYTASCTCGKQYMPDPQKSDVCVAIKYCMSNPCVNGTCTDVFGGFSCDCSAGFEGSHCQHNIDNCINNTCRNGARCVDGVGNYSCKCPPGFEGSFCQENIIDCTGQCVQQNTESCQDLVVDYQCSCKTAYTGKNCSENVDECIVGEPCRHGGNCSDLTGNYTCACPVGYAGDNCEQEINYCSSGTCKNMGTCYNLVDRYYCQCQDGTAGANCEHMEQLCDKFSNSTCSSGGTCELSGGTVRCQCLGDYSGIACELEKNYCADNPCNGGLCTLGNQTYVCNCSNVKNYGGRNCNEKNVVCNACPNITTCLEFEDQNGYLKPACLCSPNATLVGSTCNAADRDYDLVFLESFANKGTFLTSESGFYLGNNTNLSITMWVAAAKRLDKDQFILALRSSKMNSPFLSVFNTELRFMTDVNISLELTEDTGVKHSLDESFTWHLVSVVWTTNGSVHIIFDFITLKKTTISIVPPSGEFVFVQLGQSFYGYISQVSVWKTALTPEDHYEMFNKKLAVPQPDSLLLGWTQYSSDSSVRRTKPSTAAGSISICDIPDTIAKKELDSQACKNKTFTDKTSPQVNYCNESAVLPTDYSKHQVSSSELGYEFIDDTDGKLMMPERQFFSFGAYDIAVSAMDMAGNIGVCMTRAYITPNKCSDTEPSPNNTKQCSDNSNGRQVTCPDGMLPSVSTPRFVMCGKLQTYNLDNMYEKPDGIVCGVRVPRSVTAMMMLNYAIKVDCQPNVLSSVNSAIKSKIMELNKNWPGLCSDQNCSNVNVNATCNGLRMVSVNVQISSLGESLNSTVQMLTLTPLELLRRSVAEKTPFDIQTIASAQLMNNTSAIGTVPSCEYGYRLSGLYCVQCGPGSFYHEGQKQCKLCEVSMYSNQSGSNRCTDCTANQVTFQRGSSGIDDCRINCSSGQMLNITSNECVPCPRNFYQDQAGKHYCFPCPPTYGTENNGSNSLAQCIAFCKPGTELKGQDCVECQRGFYRPGYLQDPCTPCPLLNITTRGNGSISENECNIPNCSPGYFVQGNVSLVCQPCDYGSYQPNKAEFECLPCGVNFTTENTTTTNASLCRFVCPAGHEEHPPGSQQCMPCQRGYYRTGDLDQRFNNCTMCSVGFTTVTHGSSNVTDCRIPICMPGMYLNMTQEKCFKCPYNFYQNETLQESCLPCPNDWQTQTDGAVSIDNCTFVCPPGYEVNSTGQGCTICPRGAYKNESMKFERCTNCSSNITTDSEGATNVTMCNVAQCFKGYRASTDNTTCLKCPVGTYQDMDMPFSTTVCQPCPQNTSTQADVSTSLNDCKVVCPAGHEERPPGSQQCMPCQRGYYRTGDLDQRFNNCTMCSVGFTTVTHGSSNVTDCRIPICMPGMYLNMTQEKCFKCPYNFYQNETLQESCLPCPNDWQTQTDGAVSIDNCTFVCPPGYEVNSTGQGCTICPRGAYKNESMKFERCTNCSSNITTDSEGATNVTMCNVAQCSKGYRVSADNTTCLKCPVGTYQDMDMPFSTTVCQLCPQNTSTQADVSTSLNDCKVACEPGFGVTRGKCEPCPRGTWNSGNDTLRFLECQQCLVNFTTDVLEKATDVTNCSLRDCGPGTYFDNSTIDCLPCEKGYYQNQSLQKDCMMCPVNTSTRNTGSSSQDDCTIFCPAEEGGETGECLRCGDNKYKDKADFGPCQNCTGELTSTPNNRTSCTEIFCDQGRELKDGNCTDCEVGFYKSSQGNLSCTKCPGNTTTSGNRSTSVGDCSNTYCDPGFFTKDNKTCTECPTGFYKNESGNQNCTECPRNVTTDGVGKMSSSDCYLEVCQKGYFRNSSNLCKVCDIGFYQDLEGQTSCKNCSANYTTLHTGADDENDCRIVCQAGSYRNDSTNKCLLCPLGSYQGMPGKNECMSCLENYTTASEGSVRQDQCQMSCPQGYYHINRSQCLPCPIGQYQNDTGQSSCKSCGIANGYERTTASTASKFESDCIPICSKGVYLNRSTKSCDLCPAGSYKNTTNLDTECTPCSYGLTTAGEGETSAKGCTIKICGKGNYRVRNSTVCMLCPIGQYQDSATLDVFTCNPCKNSKTTLIEGSPAETYCVMNCPSGQEYKPRSMKCVPCPVGQYRLVNITTPPTCIYCQNASTTIGRGESSCISEPSATLPMYRRNVSVNVTFTVKKCDNPLALETGIRRIILILIQNQNDRRYSDLCVGNCQSKVTIRFLSICGPSIRKKRQTSDTAMTTVTVNDVDSVLMDKNNVTRSTVAVIEEAFYDTEPAQNDTETYQLALALAPVVDCGQACVIDSDGNPQYCQSGQFTGTNKCEPCAIGYYSTSPVSKNCDPCPDGQTTQQRGADSIALCYGKCAFEPTYCGQGSCMTDADGKHFCLCPSGQFGPACEQREEAEDTNIKVVVGVSVGAGGLLLIVLSVVGCIACSRSQARKKLKGNFNGGSQVPSSDASYKYPIFAHPMMMADPTMYSREVIDLDR